MKRRTLFLGFSILMILGMYFITIPNLIEGKVPEASQYLTDLGYNNIEKVSISGLTYSIKFKAVKKDEKFYIWVRFVNGGGMSIRKYEKITE